MFAGKRLSMPLEISTVHSLERHYLKSAHKSTHEWM